MSETTANQTTALLEDYQVGCQLKCIPLSVSSAS
jgi:hypothetical protein